MYATAQPFASFAGARQALGGLYQQVRVESKVDGASPHELVAMLFEGFMEAVAQARGAMREKQAEIKGMAIGRAVRIVEEGLRAGLDRRAGGTLARDLDELYSYLAMRLTLANLRNDEAALEECQRLMRPLHEAWLAIAEEAETLVPRHR
ncbi:MAG: flagellar export chaperone FliS [Rubrivivax sp.]|nr:flagellar export chaperone FliS [Rubrivivax sp.]